MFANEAERSTILAVIPADPGFVSLRRMLRENHTILRARTLGEARWFLDRNAVDVVLASAGLPERRTWIDVLDAIQSGAGAEPLVVTSHCADEFLWAEVLNLGGYDVLAQPFEEEEVVRVLASAFRERRRARVPRRGPGRVHTRIADVRSIAAKR